MLTSKPITYDEVPYDSLPVPGSHPDRLSTVARLPGMDVPAVDVSRVLELGCAGGGNLIPMAIGLPRAQFTGVDLSPVQVADGETVIRALQLSNVKLVAASVMDIDESFGEFDYIIAHGIYSWVPNAVQEKILDICQRNLAPRGVAYVSYNTLPGWRTRGMIRDLMRYHALQFETAGERVPQARAMLEIHKFFTRSAVMWRSTDWSACTSSVCRNVRSHRKSMSCSWRTTSGEILRIISATCGAKRDDIMVVTSASARYCSP